MMAHDRDLFAAHSPVFAAKVRGIILADLRERHWIMHSRLLNEAAMVSKTTPYIVITDLDGTLLDHYTYQYEAAAPALALLASRDIPLVLSSSKTAAEIHSLRLALHNHEPFIVENGAAIYLPVSAGVEAAGMEVVRFGMNRADVIAIAHAVRESLNVRFTGFSEMSIDTLISHTGLDDSSAAQALRREFTEPVVWEDSGDNRRRFIDAVERQGLTVVQGGRFMHLSGPADKGGALEWLRAWYARRWDCAPVLIALGDSDNDKAMLESADLPVLVKSPVKPFPAVDHARLYRTGAVGPEGWNEAIHAILAADERRD